MRLLFDQNLSPRLVGQLADEFPGSEHVRDVGLAAAPDPILWAHASTHGLVIASKDTDFQQRALLYGHPPKVIWIRLGNCSTSAVTALTSGLVGADPPGSKSTKRTQTTLWVSSVSFAVRWPRPGKEPNEPKQTPGKIG